jgi:chromosome segregation ATPase
MDIQILQDQLAGLETKGKQLRDQEAVLLKLQGLREQEETARVAATELEADLQKIKEDITATKSKRTELMAGTIEGIQNSISEALPAGKAIVRMDENGFFLGWAIYGREKPYKALSDGEKATFNPALCKALGADILICEAAEADADRLAKLLEGLAKLDVQSIVCTWFVPQEVPKGWNVVQL